MPRYRKKPVDIYAWQWDGDYEKLIEAVLDEVGEDVRDRVFISVHYPNILHVKTLEGVVSGSLGSRLMRGVRGEYYICDKEIFEETYERSD